VAAFTGLVSGQAPAAGGQAPAAPAAGRGGGRGGAQIPPAKLARLSMMTLNHGALFKTPWATNATERQTMTWLEVPQYYVDTYGIRNVEFQHSHIAQDTTNPSVEFFRELKAKFDAAGSKAVQINVEIGQMVAGSPTAPPAALSGDARATWLATAKKWVDAAPVLGVERLMWNQTGLNDSNKAGVIALWKELQDYAKPKGIKISNEMRGGGPVAGDGRPSNQAAGGGNRGGGAPATGAPTKAPNMPGPVMTGMKHAQLLQEAAEKSGGYTNLDFGGNTRFLNQNELHDAIKMMLKTNAGSMHIKSCENWDIGLAVKFSESQGYRGLYTIEVNPHNAITVVIGSIVSML
jgi:hypothetical protein